MLRVPKDSFTINQQKDKRLPARGLPCVKGADAEGG